MQVIERLRRERALGYNISRLLRETDHTAEELARFLRCNEMHITELETGSVIVDETEVEKIADFFAVEKEELYQAADEEVINNSIHLMGKYEKAEDMLNLMDKMDMYVRLLNKKTEK